MNNILLCRFLWFIFPTSSKSEAFCLYFRHLTFQLQTLHKYLSSQEKMEMVSALETLTARCEGTTQALALDNGVILPPLHLTEIPFVR